MPGSLYPTPPPAVNDDAARIADNSACGYEGGLCMPGGLPGIGGARNNGGAPTPGKTATIKALAEDRRESAGVIAQYVRILTTHETNSVEYALSEKDIEASVVLTMKVTRSVKDEMRQDSEGAGFKSTSEYLRTAWRLARKHPELLHEVRDEEIEYQRSRPMSGWHPDARRD